jgi:hypothetical protein
VAGKPKGCTLARPPRLAKLSPFWGINLWTICPARARPVAGVTPGLLCPFPEADQSLVIQSF